jgi:hypothetical protein
MRRWQRPFSWLALSTYLVSAVGLPLPASFKKQRNEAYPCMHHACGCLSASECWDHCCCFSAAEKLAWAREHHVEPPAQLLSTIALLASVGIDASAKEPAAQRAATCCDAGKTATGLACHDEHDHHDEHAAPHDAPCCADHADDAGQDSTLVLAIRARTCRGLAELWCLTGAVMPSGPTLDWRFEWNVVEWLSAASGPILSQDLAPPIPPPRV